MKCSDFEEKLSDYIEQALQASDREAMDLHLGSCRSCSELRAGITLLMDTTSHFPVCVPPPWLASKIVANTPRIRRWSLRSLFAVSWQSLGESRTALAIFTTAIVIGWVGGGTARDSMLNRAEGVMSCAYDHAVRSYYRSPVIIELHSRLDQFMENS